MAEAADFQKIEIQKIDAHHHLWRYTPEEYGWIDDRMKVLRRDYLLNEFLNEMEAAGIDASVLVQARQTLKETDWLLSIAESPKIRGVVGWAPIASKDFPAHLDRLRTHPKLKGLRHAIQDEQDANFIHGTDFNRGIERIKDTGLVYDILIFERQLEAAIEFVDRHPNQLFVLDHCAKPRIREEALEPWRKNIFELARRKNIYCKLSGMVTEADWNSWSEASLWRYIEIVLEAFGPQRVMAGSDWPVCLLASTYCNWFDFLGRVIAGFSSSERGRILGGTASEVYRLHG